MKIVSIIALTLLLASCESSRQGPSLSAGQAATQAMRLANDKAFALYQSRPFQDGKPAQLVAGHWTWSDQRGYGHGDIQATVELAKDGSTNNVSIQLLGSQTPGSRGGSLFQGGGGGGGF